MRFASRGNLEETGRQIDRAWDLGRKNSRGQEKAVRSVSLTSHEKETIFGDIGECRVQNGQYRTRSDRQQVFTERTYSGVPYLLEDVVVEKSSLRPVGNVVTVWTWDGSLSSTYSALHQVRKCRRVKDVSCFIPEIFMMDGLLGV